MSEPDPDYVRIPWFIVFAPTATIALTAAAALRVISPVAYGVASGLLMALMLVVKRRWPGHLTISLVEDNREGDR